MAPPTMAATSAEFPERDAASAESLAKRSARSSAPYAVIDSVNARMRGAIRFNASAICAQLNSIAQVQSLWLSPMLPLSGLQQQGPSPIRHAF